MKKKMLIPLIIAAVIGLAVAIVVIVGLSSGSLSGIIGRFK